jgi:hypothetical protein
MQSSASHEVAHGQAIRAGTSAGAENSKEEKERINHFVNYSRTAQPCRASCLPGRLAFERALEQHDLSGMIQIVLCEPDELRKCRIRWIRD